MSTSKIFNILIFLFLSKVLIFKDNLQFLNLNDAQMGGTAFVNSVTKEDLPTLNEIMEKINIDRTNLPKVRIGILGIKMSPTVEMRFRTKLEREEYEDFKFFKSVDQQTRRRELNELMHNPGHFSYIPNPYIKVINSFENVDAVVIDPF